MFTTSSRMDHTCSPVPSPTASCTSNEADGCETMKPALKVKKAAAVSSSSSNAYRPDSTSPLARRFLGYSLLRTVLLDLPLLLVVLSYAGTMWLKHIQYRYMIPQLKAASLTEDRIKHENTYYNRNCDVSDMTTTNGADLFLPSNATARDAYQHQLLHGFSVFPRVLSERTATNLRNHVVARNKELQAEESIYVHAAEHRYSFGLGTENKSVRAAMMEFANEPRMRAALEEVLGPDPALIEMATVTSEYEAVSQSWHCDVLPQNSVIQWGRTYGPSYSVFIQLQNTTKAMGATEICPGTHFCPEGGMDEFCAESGFQLVGENGMWGQGDALLMNMNSWHRGFAHTDPDAPDRVMLILTFAPKPMTRAESRLLSMGITFSLRWDMWGHTLNDLAQADTRMVQPWTTLRALGLYKPPSASWGIDYITSASTRHANDDYGFRQYDLEAWRDRGGFKYLPTWLQQFDIDWEADQSWGHYIKGTQQLCEAFTEKASRVAVVGYVALFFLFSLTQEKQHRFRCFGSAICRVALVVAVSFMLLRAAKQRVDSTAWASEIRAVRRFASMVDTERAFAKPIAGPSTFPTRQDVLIETRYGGEQLAMYNDYVTIGHPGNRFFQGLVSKASPHYGGYGEEFRNATAVFLAETIAMQSGRFLHQGPDGYWAWLDLEDSLFYIKRELAINANSCVKSLMQSVRFIKSNYQYGVFRETALARRHAVPYMEDIEKLLLNETTSPPPMQSNAKPRRVRFFPSFTLPAAHSNARRVASVRTLHIEPNILPPHEGAWLAEGDVAEGLMSDKQWYFGHIKFVTAEGMYELVHPDGAVYFMDQWNIRPFIAIREEPGINKVKSNATSLRR